MDFREKAFASVQEATKLLITLSTGFIAFTVAFSRDFMKAQFGSVLDKTLRWIASVSSCLVLDVEFGRSWALQQSWSRRLAMMGIPQMWSV